MNRNKIFSSSIISTTAFFITLTILPFWFIMCFALLTEGGSVFYGLSGILATVFGIVLFILETILSIKSRKDSATFGEKKTLIITTMVFEFLVCLTTLLLSVLGIQLFIVPIGAEGLLSYAPFSFPLLFAAVSYLISFILKLVAICCAKKHSSTAEIQSETVENHD